MRNELMVLLTQSSGISRNIRDRQTQITATMQYRLSTLHLLLATWLAAVVGAAFGGLFAYLQSGLAAALGIVPFGIAWGGVFGLVTAGIAAVVVVESTASRSFNGWWPVAWSGIAVAMGTSFYWVCVV